MIIRTALAVAAIALGITAVAAQQDPIAARKALMKANGEQARTANAIVKGEAPFDLAKAHAVFAQFAEAAEKMPNLFPDNSKTGDTRALPKIWENMDDVKAKFAKFGADAKAAQAATKDLDSFKTQFPAVTRNCGPCHEQYRRPQS